MKRSSGHGVVPSPTGRKISSFPAGRVCATNLCVTVLSVYNASWFCSVHESAAPGSGWRH